jgi:HEAT repeat protein
MENVKLWLNLVSTREIPKNYYFSVSEQPLLFSDELLKDVQEALKTTRHTKIQKYLIKVLEGRKDKESLDIIFAYLDSKDSSVRYWTVDTLKGKQPVEVLNKLIDMLKNPEQRVVSITKVLIENNIDSLQDIYEQIYQTDKSRDWQRSSIEYLSNFPKQNHKKIFLEILENPKSDFFAKADASMGLANLKDESSVDAIIKACEEESAHSDYNARPYLIALSKIKGEKARKYIEKYKNSKEKIVKDLAKELIAGWDN